MFARVKSFVVFGMLVVLVCGGIVVLSAPLSPALVLRQLQDGNHAAFAASVRTDGGVVRWHDEMGYTLLHWAAAMGDAEAAEALLNAGADPDARDGRGRTPLHLAAATIAGQGDAVLRSLLARGASIDAPDARGATPLESARTVGRPQMADALLAAGAKPEHGPLAESQLAAADTNAFADVNDDVNEGNAGNGADAAATSPAPSPRARVLAAGPPPWRHRLAVRQQGPMARRWVWRGPPGRRPWATLPDAVPRPAGSQREG